MDDCMNFAGRQDKTDLHLPAALVIMDGYGLAPSGDINAISQTDTPVLDSLFNAGDWVRLQASGESVGLPSGQMGNSEVGHLNIGAGRIVYQELSRINNACKDGSLKSNPVLKDAFSQVRSKGSVLHLMGLLSDGGVHSSNVHLYALIDAAVDAGVENIAIHCFLDGRDVPPASAIGYVDQLQEHIDAAVSKSGRPVDASIASISGRYYAMDRDNRWERVQKAYETVVCGANESSLTPQEALRESYSSDITDEFVVPVSFGYDGMHDGDAVIFFNFRPDRAREITRTLTDPEFDSFKRMCAPEVMFVCLTEYDPSIEAPVVFPKTFPENVLADVLSQEGLSQYHIAETEKYAHVTFFLNGGIEEPKPGEDRVLIPSPKVATYDLQPEMSGPEVADTLAKAIEEDAADVYIVNFANCDMVGHTGKIDAAVAAVQAVDSGIGKVLKAIEDKSGFAFVTADHGNADCMVAPDGSPHTAHTTAPVPFILADYTGKGLELSGKDGKLADIAPTILAAIGLPAPPQMTGENLLAC